MRLRSLFIAACIVSIVAECLPAADGPPNVLVIFADDQTYHSINALGNHEIQTPNLDRLVRRGVTFTHTYNQGSWSGAVCVASRTMLMTGRYLWRAHSVYRNTAKELAAGRFWTRHMQRAGYTTYFTGKWHVRAKPEAAFDVVRHPRGGMPNQTPTGYNRPIDGQPDKWKPWDPQFGGFWKGGRHWSEVVADDATQFLSDATKKDDPFFMYVAFNAPHDPRQAPESFVNRYPLNKIAVPKNFLPAYPHQEGIGLGPKLRDEKLAPFPRDRHAVKVHRQEYYAIITHMDEQIGRILDALENSEANDNTYIFFSADHGLAVGQHGLMGKQNMYDHSVRVPLVVVGPGVPSNERIATPVYLQDMMATTLELAGLERPEHVEFHSLMPLIRDGRASAYDAIYGAYLKVQRMVTDDGWKLILYPEPKVARLYNLRDDPHETLDLINDAEHAPRARRLFATFRQWQQRTGDTLDVASRFPLLARSATD